MAQPAQPAQGRSLGVDADNALLDRRNGDSAAADSDGRTPLHRAIDSAAVSAARQLVEDGADVNQPDRWGNTPLWRAIYHAPLTVDIAHLLLDHGADPTAKNNHDVSPLDLAKTMAQDLGEVADILPKLDARSSSHDIDNTPNREERDGPDIG